MEGNPLDLPSVKSSDPLALHTPPVKDSDLPAYRYAKALCESARAASQDRRKTFKTNWDFFLGKDHFNNWPRQTLNDQWMFRGVVNWTFATIKTKASILTSAQTQVFIEPLDDESTYYDRLLIKSAVTHEAKRLRFQQVKEDVYLSGSVTGIGVSMHTLKPDPLTGAMMIQKTPIRSEEFLHDPSADSITSPQCRFVVWDSEQDMSRIREMFSTKAPQVKPESRQVTGGWTYKPPGTENDQNLIYGSAGEFAVTREDALHSRKARVVFVWIRDESIVEDIHEVLIKEASMGFQCTQCAAIFEETPEIDASSHCPHCMGEMENAPIPPKYEQNRVVRRKYPYGRLIIYSPDVLLFDGENPYEIEGVFPFSVYHHERIPGSFHGANDVELLESLQDAQNRSICQLIDYVRLGVNSPILYPTAYKAITDMGNGPAQRLPGPNQLPWQPYKLSAQGFDVNSWQALVQSINFHFQIVSGLANQAFGQTSSPPISATEAEIANARMSDRMRGHATALAQWASDDLEIQYQLMQQVYGEPITVPVTMPDSEVKSISVEVQKLPKARVKIVVSQEDTVKDKLIGQNALQMAASGLLDSPYADLFLGKIGASPTEIKEFQERRGLAQELNPQLPAAPPSNQPPAPNLSVIPGGGQE